MNILFVCTGNTCRSPMAEAIAKEVLNKAEVVAEVSSAGVYADVNSPASYNAIQAVAKWGGSLDKHISRKLDVEMLKKATIILTMGESHKTMVISLGRNNGYDVGLKVFTLAEYANEKTRDIPDPFCQSFEIYDRCSYEIRILIEKIVEEHFCGSNWQ